MISVIIPTLNDAARLSRALAPLVAGVADGLVKQAILADGGSRDDTLAIAEATGCDIAKSAPGRGRQLIAGVAAAKGPWFLFLCAGTMLDQNWIDDARQFLMRGDSQAGAFRLALEENSLGARALELLARARRPRAEQGLLISRALYESVGGYTDVANPHADLAARIGARRLTILRTKAIYREAEPLVATPDTTRASSGV